MTHVGPVKYNVPLPFLLQPLSRYLPPHWCSLLVLASCVLVQSQVAGITSGCVSLLAHLCAETGVEQGSLIINQSLCQGFGCCAALGILHSPPLGPPSALSTYHCIPSSFLSLEASQNDSRPLVFLGSCLEHYVYFPPPRKLGLLAHGSVVGGCLNESPF